VSGGPNWNGSGQPVQGPYGIQVASPPCSPLADDFYTKWDYYCLGALIEKFPRPGYQFLLTEGEVASDDYSGIWPYDPIVLNASSGIPAWSGQGGWYAFRHVLPREASLYQTQATANFLYIDGHVNYMTANNPINCVDRFAFAQ
jgi:prepilin-type processing-associated H-X9-DG protein